MHFTIADYKRIYTEYSSKIEDDYETPFYIKETEESRRILLNKFTNSIPTKTRHKAVHCSTWKLCTRMFVDCTPIIRPAIPPACTSYFSNIFYSITWEGGFRKRRFRLTNRYLHAHVCNKLIVWHCRLKEKWQENTMSAGLLKTSGDWVTVG